MENKIKALRWLRKTTTKPQQFPKCRQKEKVWYGARRARMSACIYGNMRHSLSCYNNACGADRISVRGERFANHRYNAGRNAKDLRKRTDRTKLRERRIYVWQSEYRAPSNLSPESDAFKQLVQERIAERKEKLASVGYTDESAPTSC